MKNAKTNRPAEATEFRNEAAGALWAARDMKAHGFHIQACEMEELAKLLKAEAKKAEEAR